MHSMPTSQAASLRNIAPRIKASGDCSLRAIVFQSTGKGCCIMRAIDQETAATQFPKLQPPVRYLFGPGPTMVHSRVYEALSKPIVGHLDAYFIQVMSDVQQLLKTAYGTEEGATLVISGTGSAGMEAAVSNFLEPGAKFAVFANGYFSDRLTEMANS